MLFSHLATHESAVVVFSPQIDLVDDKHHVSRYDMSTEIRNRFFYRLIQSVEEAILLKRTIIFIHRGLDTADVRQTDRLMQHCSSSTVMTDEDVKRVKFVKHEDCRHHQIAVHLKEEEELSIFYTAI